MIKIYTTQIIYIVMLEIYSKGLLYELSILY